MRRQIAPLAALGLVALMPGALMAQGAAKNNPAPVQPDKAQIETAAFQMSVLVSALQSDKVEAPVKEVLFGCIYSNPFSKISEAMGKVIAANAAKVDPKNADQVLVIMAGVCGFRPQPAAAAAKPATPPAKPAAAQPARPAQGR